MESQKSNEIKVEKRGNMTRVSFQDKATYCFNDEQEKKAIEKYSKNL